MFPGKMRLLWVEASGMGMERGRAGIRRAFGGSSAVPWHQAQHVAPFHRERERERERAGKEHCGEKSNMYVWSSYTSYIALSIICCLYAGMAKTVKL